MDIAEVLRRAGDLESLDALYVQHAAVMEQNDFDEARASLQVMGDRLRRTLAPATRQSLEDLVREQVDEDGWLELVREMDARVVDSLARLRALLRGLQDPGTAQ